MSAVPPALRSAKRRRKAVAVLVVAGALAIPVAARADPGTAGVSDAPDAAYPTPGPTVLGKEPVSTHTSVPFSANATVPASADNGGGGGDGANISSPPLSGVAAGGGGV